MLEISFIELGLLLWAVLATAGYFSASHDARAAKFMIKTLIENKEVRDGIVAKFEEMQKEGTA